jgi:hypothetical protein
VDRKEGAASGVGSEDAGSLKWQSPDSLCIPNFFFFSFPYCTKIRPGKKN